MPADPNKARELFLHAVGKLPPDQWDRYVSEAARGDADLEKQVRRFLQVHCEAGSFLESPADPLIGAVSKPIGEVLGTTIGRYKLLEQIGEGGFGVVFMAEQQQPIRRKVALKVIKPGMDTRQVIARFEAERQALALMEHPNIAHVLDGGETATGRPYFVMELVRGIPITEYGDRYQLPVPQRLELFATVCQAVQHAHQKGIIHRDIKPSNVLVTLHDGAPVVKVIDFGVAKAMGQHLTEKSLFTNFAQMIGTPIYMSPEQAELSGLDVDTRTDIYALGVLVYELLTGTTPFDRERLKTAAFDEIRRIIREDEPAKPSTRIHTLGETASTVTANRKSDPSRLSRLYRGELDWIAMKCLEKDRTRRYQTANGVAKDIQRYLNDEPVEAGPPSAAYRLRKFGRRYRHVLAVALAFVLLLVAAVTTLSIALVAVNQERREKEGALDAEAKRRQQTRTALDAMSSQVIEEWLGKQLHLSRDQKQFLEQALGYYEDFAADTGQEEESRAGIAHANWRVGLIRNRLGQRKEAEAVYLRSRDLYARLAGDFPGNPDYRHYLARVCVDLGILYRDAGHTQKSEKALIHGQGINRDLAAEFPANPLYRQHLARSLNHLCDLHKVTGRAREAETACAEALAVLKELAAQYPLEPSHRHDLAQTHLVTGHFRESTGRAKDSEESYAEAVDLLKELVADFPDDADYRDSLARSQNNLGVILQHSGRHTDAEEILRQTLAIRKQLVADFPATPIYRQGLAMTLNNLGIVFKDTGQMREAQEVYSQALDIHKRLAADFPGVPDHQNELAGAMVNLARLFLLRSEFDSARRLLEEALPLHQAALKASPRHPAYRRYYRNNRWRLAETLLELKDHAAAADVAGQFLLAAVEPPRDAYTTACLYAGCIRLATQEEALSESKQEEIIALYADSALAALRLAIERGAKEVAQLKNDPNLHPLRPREDFQKLLASLEATSVP